MSRMVWSSAVGAGLLAMALVAFSSRSQTISRTESGVAQDTELGQRVYAERCEICHGTQGDGNGPAAPSLDPRPRDFRRGWYKIRSTSSGQLPTDSDLLRVITIGMPGTTMQAWGEVLTEQEIEGVAAYIKTFSRRFERESPEPVPVVAAPASSLESITRGGQLFTGEQAECSKCHGEMGRGDGPSASDLTDDFGDPIFPSDLRMPWLFRGGPAAQDIYMRLKTGLTGSPMPSYAQVLSDEELWDLAYYVDSLGPDVPAQQQAFILAVQVQGALPSSPLDAVWQDAAENYIPLAGQVMLEPRNFTPNVKGVWITALHNGSELALRLRWNDRFQNSGDAFDVLLPAVLEENDKRPYFVYGQRGKTVNVWRWESEFQERNSEGVGTGIVQVQQDLTGSAEFESGQYTLVVKRALDTGDPEDLKIPTGVFIPIAFAASDAGTEERTEFGAINSWQLIHLDRPTAAVSYIWIPIAILVTAGLEWLVMYRVRKSASN